MPADLVEPIAAIARRCCHSHHWALTPKGPRHQRSPLRKSQLELHVSGAAPVGVCPIAPGEATTRVAVLDLDSHKGEVAWQGMIDAARDITEALRAYGIEPIPVRSTGGRGIHLLMLWAEAQDAYSVRSLLTEVLASKSYTSGTKGVKAREVEIFPKQDSVPPDGYGSMFVLPYARESVPIDPQSWELRDLSYAEYTPMPESKPIAKREPPPAETRPEHTTPPDLRELKSALMSIPNEDMDYDGWRDVIFALHHATEGSDEGLALAHEWSARSPKHTPEFLDNEVWPYIRSDRGEVITARTIYAKALEHGWIDNVLDDFERLPAEDGNTPPATDNKALASAGSDPRQAPPSLKFAILSAAEFIASRSSPQWLITGVLPKAELAVLYGESGSGKSFLALDMAAAIAQGIDWRGHRTRQGRVVYVAAEGAGGFRNRLAAYHEHFEVELSALGVMADAPNFLVPNDVRAVLDSVKHFGRPDVMIVDTFAQVTPGANENSGEDVGKVIGHCRALHRATGALVLLVHHAGKDPTKGARGWSGLRAAADAEIEVSRNGDARMAILTKLKDGNDGMHWPFRLSVVDLGHDSDGNAVNSCVVEHQIEEEHQARRREPSGNAQRVVWRCAHELTELAGGSVPVDMLLEAVRDKLPQDSGKRDQRKARALRAIEQLVEDRFLHLDGNEVSVI